MAAECCGSVGAVRPSRNVLRANLLPRRPRPPASADHHVSPTITLTAAARRATLPLRPTLATSSVVSRRSTATARAASSSSSSSSSSFSFSSFARPTRGTRAVGMSIACEAAASSDDAETSAPRRKRMIALHGKGGNGPSFERYMQPLVEATSHEWEWTFLTGPHEVDGGGRGWWQLPPGVRTFEAEKLEGIEESLAMVEAAWPFDGITGFSQGAMLAAVVCGRGVKRAGEGAVGRPSVAIIAGAAWPTARGDDVRRLQRVEWAAAEAEDVSVPEAIAALVPPPPPLVTSVHTVGARDAVNPPEQARKVAEAFGHGAELLEHGGAHEVPLDENAIAAYVRAMGVSPNQPP